MQDAHTDSQSIRDRARANAKALLADTKAAIDRERPYYSIGEIAMYLLTLVGEIPVIFARLMVTTMIVAIIMLIQGSTHVSPELAWLALVPTMWSALALIVPLGSGWWWRTSAGGRQPSSRERLVYEDAVELLQATARRRCRCR